jgi:hypothetical protein
MMSGISGAAGAAKALTDLPVNPFLTLSYHFGMLLGVDDFETEQAYHRGKMRIHNAWLHGAGVVWGLRVDLEEERGEIRVQPGLALDPAGHELYLASEACVNVGEWFDANRESPGFEFTETDTGVRFDAFVEIRFKACLTRAVPAFMEPCAGSETGLAYSRVTETVDIRLTPGTPAAGALPYHRLRLLFGLDQPVEEEGTVVDADQEVLDARAAVFAEPASAQPAAMLAAFRRMAALDEMDLQPYASEDGRLSFFPAPDLAPVLLARISGITLSRNNGAWVLEGGEVDNTVRPSHVAGSTVQELLCGGITDENAAAGAEAGPRADPASVTVTGQDISITFDAPLQEASLSAGSFSVSAFDETEGWTEHAIEEVAYEPATLTVTVTLAEEPSGSALRVIAAGTGPTPILGENLLPVSGSLQDPAHAGDRGRDFVWMRRS